MFYDENGKHVRTKKEILDEAGQLRKGCKIIPKGEVYERTLFNIKDSRFKNDRFLDEVKRSYTDLINIYVKDDKQKLRVSEAERNRAESKGFHSEVREKSGTVQKPDYDGDICLGAFD